MTKNQIKFLKTIYNKEKTVEALCKELKIEPYKNDDIGGYYNALNKHINYLQSDDNSEIDDMFEIIFWDESTPNNATYIITSQGKTYIEDCNHNDKRYYIQTTIAVIAIIVTVVIFLIQIA